MTYLTNTFSIAMLKANGKIAVTRIRKEDIPENAHQFVNHFGCKRILEKELGFKMYRGTCGYSVKVGPGDVIYYARFTSHVSNTDTELPLGCSIEYYKIDIL